MCNKCSTYLSNGCAFCLDCGVPLNISKQASAENASESGFFKHASEDLELEILKNPDNDKKNTNNGT